MKIYHSCNNKCKNKSFETNYLEKVKKDGHSIQWIPKSFRTSELCLAAIKQNGKAFKHIIQEQHSISMHLEALKNPGHGTYCCAELRDVVIRQFKR